MCEFACVRVCVCASSCVCTWGYRAYVLGLRARVNAQHLRERTRIEFDADPVGAVDAGEIGRNEGRVAQHISLNCRQLLGAIHEQGIVIGDNLLPHEVRLVREVHILQVDQEMTNITMVLLIFKRSHDTIMSNLYFSIHKSRASGK